MARGKNYYRSVIEPFFPHSQFSLTGREGGREGGREVSE
jgi:hypothetical protein